MNILLVSYSFAPVVGGLEEVADLLAAGLAHRGHEVAIVTRTPGGAEPGVFRRPSLWTLIRLYRDADVVLHNHLSLRCWWPQLLIKRPHLAIVHTWLNHGSPRQRVRRRLKIMALRRADRVVAVSEAVAESLPFRPEVIRNGYRDDVYFLAGPPAGNSSVVFVGRLVSDKGVDTLLRAVAVAARDCPQISLTVIGDGPDRAALDQLAQEIGLAGSVRFVGRLAPVKVAAELRRHSILAVPSKWREPFGLVALEGMACGCVPVVSDGGGLPEVVGNAGLVYERKSVTDLASKISSLACDQDLLVELRRRAQAVLATRTALVMIVAYEKLLGDLAKAESQTGLICRVLRRLEGPR